MYFTIANWKRFWPFLIIAFSFAVLTIVPLTYLGLRAFEADAVVLIDLIFRQRNLYLLGNTFALIGGVLCVSTLIALPLAWISQRWAIKGHIFITLLGVLPLALPGYVLAYSLMGLGGYYGLIHQVFGLSFPQIEGYWGSLIALSLYCFPFLFLNLRTALLGLDARQEEASRSLGFGSVDTFFKVILPQLWPAFLSGWLVMALYVLGDFGTIALMRFPVFSYAIYTQYTGAFDRIYTAWLALMLLSLAVSFITAEYYASKHRRLHSTGTGISRPAVPKKTTLFKSMFSYFLIAVLFLLTVVVPVLTLFYWLTTLPASYDYWPVVTSFYGSLKISSLTAVCTVIMILPIVYLQARYKTALSSVLERIVLVGYSIPSLALALAFVFFGISAMPFLYQTLALLLMAYVVHFGTLAMGPLRSSLLQHSARCEEVSRTLGYSSVETFIRVTLPLMKKGLLASFIMVFLLVMKELPIAFVLMPTGSSTLALGMFGRTNEGLLAEASPYALGLMGCSGIFVAILLFVTRISVSSKK